MYEEPKAGNSPQEEKPGEQPGEQPDTRKHLFSQQKDYRDFKDPRDWERYLLEGRQEQYNALCQIDPEKPGARGKLVQFFVDYCGAESREIADWIRQKLPGELDSLLYGLKTDRRLELMKAGIFKDPEAKK